LKIILSYHSENDKGEGIHYARGLERLGHQVVVINSSAENNSSIEPTRRVIGLSQGIGLEGLLASVGGADLFLYVEPLGLIPFGLDRSPIPTACVISDVHRDLKSRQTLSLLFDHVFLYQRDYTSAFTQHPHEAVHWSPWACDRTLFRNLGRERDLDVAFVGQLFKPRSDRRRIMTELARRFRVNTQRYYLQAEIPEVYSRAKIVINLPVGHDLNSRFFEAMSCGALLLTTKERNGQEDLFEEGRHYVAFSSEEELFERVSYFLEHEEERAQIARAGCELVERDHSLDRRLGELVEKVRGGPFACSPVRKLAAKEVMSLYAAIYERNGWVEALLRLAARRKGDGMDRSIFLARGAKSFLRRAIHGW
jgi:hypothetical protein